MANKTAKTFLNPYVDDYMKAHNALLPYLVKEREITYKADDELHIEYRTFLFDLRIGDEIDMLTSDEKMQRGTVVGINDEGVEVSTSEGYIMLWKYDPVPMNIRKITLKRSSKGVIEE